VSVPRRRPAWAAGGRHVSARAQGAQGRSPRSPKRPRAFRRNHSRA
jgi:hypothetical protein